MRITVLAGGYGGAKLSHGLDLERSARDAGDDRLDLRIVVNTADDQDVHGLHVSPDLDTVMYTLAGVASPETGWGVRDETWAGAEMLERYGAETWFRLGDRDLATNLLRTDALRRGERLTSVTGRLARALGVRPRLLPMSDQSVRTRVRTDDGWLAFQEYFVRRHHEDAVRELRYDGLESAAPTSEVVLAILHADLIVIAPSNPFLSVAPILALKGVLDALGSSRAPVVAVSPIVGGEALRGPAARLFESLGGEASAVGVARHYAERYPGVLNALAIDWRDVSAVGEIERLGLRALVTHTVMRHDAERRTLSRQIVEFGTRIGAGGRKRRPRRSSDETVRGRPEPSPSPDEAPDQSSSSGPAPTPSPEEAA